MNVFVTTVFPFFVTFTAEKIANDLGAWNPVPSSVLTFATKEVMLSKISSTNLYKLIEFNVKLDILTQMKY